MYCICESGFKFILINIMFLFIYGMLRHSFRLLVYLQFASHDLAGVPFFPQAWCVCLCVCQAKIWPWFANSYLTSYTMLIHTRTHARASVWSWLKKNVRVKTHKISANVISNTPAVTNVDHMNPDLYTHKNKAKRTLCYKLMLGLEI